MSKEVTSPTIISNIENLDRVKFLPIKRQVLAIGAHPDDIEIEAGGLVVALMKQYGNEVHFAVCTNGDKGTWDLDLTPKELENIRQREQQESADFLEISSLAMLGLPDGYLHTEEEYLVEKLTHIIRAVRPSLVITHDPWKQYDLHVDHRTTGLAVCRSIQAACNWHYYPEQFDDNTKPHFTRGIVFFNPQQPNLWVDLEPYLDKKISAIEKHQSQFSNRSSVWSLFEQTALESGKEIDTNYAEPHHLKVHY